MQLGGKGGGDGMLNSVVVKGVLAGEEHNRSASTRVQHGAGMTLSHDTGSQMHQVEEEQN